MEQDGSGWEYGTKGSKGCAYWRGEARARESLLMNGDDLRGPIALASRHDLEKAERREAF